MVGVTTMDVALEPPGVQVKPSEDGASTDKVEGIPGQTSVGEGVTVILGPGSTTTVMVAELVQVPEAPIAV